MGTFLGECMKDYYVLRINNETLYFDSAEKLYETLEERNIPASKCTFSKMLNVIPLSKSQNYLKNHQTISISYEELKEALHKTKNQIMH